MLRSLLARLLGFEQEIDELKRTIDDLRWDNAFGMWTRAAFLQFCRIMPRGMRTVAFIDLDDVHGLNRRLGYSEVDRRVQAIFSISLRSSDIVARWYSGDEIVILFDADRDGADRKISELQASANSQEISFAYEIGEWDVGKRDITDLVEDLSDRIFENNTKE